MDITITVFSSRANITVPEVSSEAIDFKAASEQFEKIRQLSEKDLETLEIIVNHQGKKVSTVAGLLLFGKVRGKKFPDAWIQAVCQSCEMIAD